MPQLLSERPQKVPVVLLLDGLLASDILEKTFVIHDATDGNCRRRPLKVNFDVLVLVGPSLLFEVLRGEAALV